MAITKTKLLTASCLISLLALTACSSDSGSSGGGSSISCDDIAGNYTMRVAENACGGTYYGTISGNVSTDCYVNFRGTNGVTITGTFTERTASTITGRGTTSGCGAAYLVCSSTMGSCEYSYDSGGGAAIACKRARKK